MPDDHFGERMRVHAEQGGIQRRFVAREQARAVQCRLVDGTGRRPVARRQNGLLWIELGEDEEAARSGRRRIGVPGPAGWGRVNLAPGHAREHPMPCLLTGAGDSGHERAEVPAGHLHHGGLRKLREQGIPLLHGQTGVESVPGEQLGGSGQRHLIWEIVSSAARTSRADTRFTAFTTRPSLSPPDSLRRTP